MKFTAPLFTLALAGAVAALPWNDGHYKDDHKDDDWHNQGYNSHPEPDCEWKRDSFPFHFTSQLVAWAGPDTIVNNSQVAVPGLEDGYGKFAFGLNSDEDLICWNITVYVRGNYSSPAKTATHIHQARAGAAGPPRIAFANPTPKAGQPQDLNEWSWRASYGCAWGPFTTGVLNNGTDTGTNFTVAALENDPSGFFADTHTIEFPAGAVRGQLQFKDW